jgi:uncharacterized membrane protein (DUF373 family)
VSPPVPDPRGLLLRLLSATESALLYLVGLVLLAVAAGVLGIALLDAVQGSVPWTQRLVKILEELLLVLIILEVFVTVKAHLEGGRIQLEPFIVVGIIAVVRHILSIVITLSFPETVDASRNRLTELAVDTGAAFVLVIALAISRWSARRPGPEPTWPSEPGG